MGCDQTLIPYISIGNCNSELIFGMRASPRILYKNMTSYPIISKKYFCDVITSVLYNCKPRKWIGLIEEFHLCSEHFQTRKIPALRQIQNTSSLSSIPLSSKAEKEKENLFLAALFCLLAINPMSSTPQSSDHPLKLQRKWLPQ